MIRELAHRLTELISPPSPTPSRISLGGLCALYKERLERWPLPAPAPAPRGRVGVLVTPWLSTAVPLFSIELAGLLVRDGFHVTAFFDDTDAVGNAPQSSGAEAIRHVLAHPGAAIETVDVRTLPAGEPDQITAAAILKNNAIWRMRGESQAGVFLENNPESHARLAAHLGKIERMLREHPCDWILIPGGVFGLSGVYVAAARAAGVPFTTYDSGVGLLRLAHDGIAAHLGDMPQAYAAVLPALRKDEAAHERVLAEARAEIEDRMTAKHSRQFQVAPATQRDDLHYDLLVPLNIRWDSAALGRERVFASVEEWLTALLEWTSAHPTATLCIRQHPRERLTFAKSSDDWRPLFDRFAALGERFRFVSAEEEINSYDLLRKAKVVLPHTSTFGIEAAFLGKPVVLGTECYYGGFGFVWNANSRAEYFSRIEEAVEGRLTLTESQCAAAGIAYFLTQRCTLLHSLLNPHTEQFVEWVKLPAAELWARPELADVRTALVTRTPLPVVRFRRLVHVHGS